MFLRMETRTQESIKRVDQTVGENTHGITMQLTQANGRTDSNTVKDIGQREIRQKTQLGLHIKENTSLIRNGVLGLLFGLLGTNTQENMLMMKDMGKESCDGWTDLYTKATGIMGFNTGMVE